MATRMSVGTAAPCVALLVAVGSGSATTIGFRGSVLKLTPSLRESMTGRSWHEVCPVSLDDLRLVRAAHWGFDGRVHQGRLVVHRDVAAAVVGVLRRVYRDHFPIRKLVPIDAYGASDYRSIERL